MPDLSCNLTPEREVFADLVGFGSAMTILGPDLRPIEIKEALAFAAEKHFIYAPWAPSECRFPAILYSCAEYTWAVSLSFEKEHLCAKFNTSKLILHWQETPFFVTTDFGLIGEEDFNRCPFNCPTKQDSPEIAYTDAAAARYIQSKCKRIGPTEAQKWISDRPKTDA